MLRKPRHCGEKWSDLVPKEGGRKCLTCEKVLKDFSKKSFEEIKQIQSSESGPHCGIYTQKQIQYWGQEQPATSLQVARNKIVHYAMLSSLLLPLHPLIGSPEIKPPVSEIAKAANLFEDPRLQQRENKAIEHLSSTIKGVVVDSLTQEPLMGVTISIEGLKIGALTDKKGEFQIEIADSLHVSLPLNLKIQYVGYYPKDFLIKKEIDQELRIELKFGYPELDVFYVQAPPASKRFWFRVKSVFRRNNRR